MENPMNQIGNEFQTEMYAKTKKYQKIYGFDIGKGKYDTLNNEADAFKHAFMQAISQFYYGYLVSNGIGYVHELDGFFHNQPNNELNMDLWNNEIGKNIGNKMKYKLLGKKKSDYPKEKIEDIIAEEIVRKMKNGELITTPNDSRVYYKKKLGVYDIKKLIKQFDSLTGYAADILQDRIFTAEEIGQMSLKEFEKNEKLIDKQLNTIGIPRELEAKQAVQSGELIWVNSYVRDDGTQVSGYYRRK